MIEIVFVVLRCVGNLRDNNRYLRTTRLRDLLARDPRWWIRGLTEVQMNHKWKRN